MDYIINKISDTIEKTCKADPLPNLTNRTSQQGDFLPRKLAKRWTRYLNTYHLIGKTIYIAQHDPLWQTHPILNDLRNHRHANIPYIHVTTTPPTAWVDAIATIAKNTNKEARKITTKYTKDCILKAITKYRQMFEKNPKKINCKVFKNNETSSMDSIIDRQNNIQTNPEDIASKIYTQKFISNRPSDPTCHYQNIHPLYCTCRVRQYPWHDLDGYIIDKRGEPQIPLHTYFDQETYDFCLKNLSNKKTPCPDKYPIQFQKNAPPILQITLPIFSTLL